MVLVHDHDRGTVVVMPEPLENVTANAPHGSKQIGHATVDGKPMTIFSDGDGTVVVLSEEPAKVAASQVSNPLQPEPVGDLVGQKLHDWQEPPIGKNVVGVGDLIGQPLGAWLPPKVVATQVAASAPVVRRADGSFDPLQPTVGDLVQGHTSGTGPLAGRQKSERPRSPFLTI